VTIRYAATADELLRFNLRMVEERMAARFLWRDGTLAIGVAAGGLAIIVLGHWPFLHRIGFGLAVVGLTLFFFPRVRRAGLRRRLEGLAAQQRQSGATADIEVTIDDRGVTSRSGPQSRRIDWDRLAEIERDVEWVTLIARDGEVIPIPWRSVPSEDRRAGLETLLARHEAHGAAR
jgi:hypothetical protein